MKILMTLTLAVLAGCSSPYKGMNMGDCRYELIQPASGDMSFENEQFRVQFSFGESTVHFT
jgi:hypothetical protein